MQQRPSNSEAEPRQGITGAKRYPLIVIALAVLSHGGYSLSGQGFTPFYPFIRDDFSLTNTQIGFITGAIFGAATLTSAGFGWALDRFGTRILSGALLVLSGLVVASLYFASSFLLILVVAAAMGSLRPVGHPAGAKMVVDWIAPLRRGTAMSIKQAGNPALGALAAAAVPPIAIAFGWRVAAVALGLFIALAGAAILAFYRDRYPVSGRQGERTSFFAGMGRVIRNRDISLAIVFGFPLVGSQVAMLTYFILFLNDELGVSVVVAGGLLAVLQVSNIVMRIGWGVISDTLSGGRRKPVLLVSSLATAGMILVMALLPDGTPTWALVLVAIGLGGTVTSWVSVHSTLLAELSGPTQVGTTLGYASTVQRASIVLAPPLFGLVADTAGYQVAWLGMVGAMLMGIAFLFPVRERRS